MDSDILKNGGKGGGGRWWGKGGGGKGGWLGWGGGWKNGGGTTKNSLSFSEIVSVSEIGFFKP